MAYGKWKLQNPSYCDFAEFLEILPNISLCSINVKNFTDAFLQQKILRYMLFKNTNFGWLVRLGQSNGYIQPVPYELKCTTAKADIGYVTTVV